MVGTEADDLTTFRRRLSGKSGSFNLLETSCPVQATTQIASRLLCLKHAYLQSGVYMPSFSGEEFVGLSRYVAAMLPSLNDYLWY